MVTTAAPRRRKLMGHRRRVEDEGDDEAGFDVPDLDDDSLSDGTIGSDDHERANDSDTSNVDETSPELASARKSGHGATKPSHVEGKPKSTTRVALSNMTDSNFMLEGLSLDESSGTVQEIDFDEVETSVQNLSTPVVVNSTPSLAPDTQPPPHERRRREHEEYRRKRDEDPAFVPNRGAFFMHDHRHAGPAANGFRPFGRVARGRGRGGFGGLYTPMSHMTSASSDPLTSTPWAHDMHETVAGPTPARHARHATNEEGPANGNGFIRTAATSHAPINRAMATERHLGNVTVRLFVAGMKTALTFPGVQIKQYTKLPDHRPPLRRDKPVRVSLPYHDPPVMPRYVFPATDRSFIFIPRALRPNQQRVRGRGSRSVLGSTGGFSRRTSILGGSMWGGSYLGSNYSPSIAMSRRSSIAPDMGRDYIMSPTGSAFSRPPLPMENGKVTVRLPPSMPQSVCAPPMPVAFQNPAGMAVESSINDFPQPQTHPLPRKPSFQESQASGIPMHQPRPQKAVSVENIESPVQPAQAQHFQSAFHHQVPLQISNGIKYESHTRRPSYPMQQTTGTPLSQIPERAIHAAPFQPTSSYSQPAFYNQAYHPAVHQSQQGYFYQHGYSPSVGPVASAPAFVPGVPEGQPSAYNNAVPPQGDASALGGQASSSSRLISQNIGGTMYYFEPSQLPPMAAYPTYPSQQAFMVPAYAMNGVVAPGSEGMYYQQSGPGMVASADFSQYNYQSAVPGMANYPQ